MAVHFFACSATSEALKNVFILRADTETAFSIPLSDRVRTLAKDHDKDPVLKELIGHNV